MEKASSQPAIPPRKQSYFDVFNEQFRQTTASSKGFIVSVNSPNNNQSKEASPSEKSDKIITFLCDDEQAKIPTIAAASSIKCLPLKSKPTLPSATANQNQQVPTVAKSHVHSDLEKIFKTNHNNNLIGQPIPTQYKPAHQRTPETNKTTQSNTSVILREIFGPLSAKPRLRAEPAPPHPNIRSVIHSHDNIEKIMLSKARNADFLNPPTSQSAPPHGAFDQEQKVLCGNYNLPSDFHREFVPSYRYSTRARFHRDQQCPSYYPNYRGSRTDNSIDNKESHSSGQEEVKVANEMPKSDLTATTGTNSTVIDVLSGNMCQLVRRIEVIEEPPKPLTHVDGKACLQSPHIVRPNESTPTLKISDDNTKDAVEDDTSMFDRLLRGILNPYVPKHYNDATEKLHKACAKHRITMSIVYTKESILELSKSPQSHLPCTQLLKLPTELIAQIVSPHYGQFTLERYERQRALVLYRQQQMATRRQRHPHLLNVTADHDRDDLSSTATATTFYRTKPYQTPLSSHRYLEPFFDEVLNESLSNDDVNCILHESDSPAKLSMSVNRHLEAL